MPSTRLNKRNAEKISTGREEKKQMYDVEVYNGSSLISVITVKAKDQEEASKIARNDFFENINAKVKRNWN